MTAKSGRGTARQTIRVDEDLWHAYDAALPDTDRSADLRAYIQWRIDNPDAALPKGRRRKPSQTVHTPSRDQRLTS